MALQMNEFPRALHCYCQRMMMKINTRGEEIVSFKLMFQVWAQVPSTLSISIVFFLRRLFFSLKTFIEVLFFLQYGEW